MKKIILQILMTIKCLSTSSIEAGQMDYKQNNKLPLSQQMNQAKIFNFGVHFQIEMRAIRTKILISKPHIFNYRHTICQ